MINKTESVPDRLVGVLAPGPVDIVGDIHGEIEALDALLTQLGYDQHGNHAEDRQLIFVGDLVDRGPDSPAVLFKVRDLVEAGRAQCVLGNHELNLLRNDIKHGNSWWTDPARDTEHPMARITAAEKAQLMPFLESLPLALERDDLRVVHACWNNRSVAMLRELNLLSADPAQLYEHYLQKITAHLQETKTLSAVRREWRDTAPHLDDPDWLSVLMPIKARMDEMVQMDNPVAVLTSGEERVAQEPFWAGGRWRMVERVKWWEHYTDDVPVVVGHYWRRFGDARNVLSDKYGPDLFAGIEPHHWMGPRRNVYCVDFSVGARATQRASGQSLAVCKLSAVRVPEWQVMHDDGECCALV